MCVGPLSRVCHWGPLTAIGIIKLVTGMTVHCSSMWWPTSSAGGFINHICFLGLSGLTLYHFLSSLYHGPGYLPLEWRPECEDDSKHLQYCLVCHGFKAPRSHHCRKCGRCVLKMDHHCPWINNCVGWGNHAHFTCFLLFATIGCAHAAIILGTSLYRAIHRNYYLLYGTDEQPIVRLGVYGMVLTVFALGFAIGVVIAVGMLLYFQLRAIVRNRTGIEDWIVEKANFRRRNSEKFVFPYDLGTWRNIKQVLNLSCHPVGNGIDWPVAEGCDKFSLTEEQMKQKSEKRLKTKLYTIIKPTSGYYIPITQGLRVACSFPCTDEPRLKLQPGDKIYVTRWRRHWLFGEKVQDDLPEGQESLYRQRGWFPRKCAIECVEHGQKKNK